MSKTLVPKVESTCYVVNKARVLSWREVVKTIEMLVKANRPSRIQILHNTKVRI